MTLFEKLTGAATSVVFVAGILAAVLLPGAAGVTVSARGGQPIDPAAAVAGSSDRVTATTEGGSRSRAPATGSADSRAGAADDDRMGDADPLHRSTTTLLPDEALDVLDRLVGQVADADLAALTDLLDSLDPSVLDEVLAELEDALDGGTIQQVVDGLLGEVDLAVPTTLPPLTVPDLTDVVEDTTGTVDDTVDDPTGAVDDVIDDTTGTVDDVVGSTTGAGDTGGAVEDTTDSVTDTVTDTIGGLL